MTNLPAMHFPLEQEEIILTARSRLFTLRAKGFHLPQVDLSVRVVNAPLVSMNLIRILLQYCLIEEILVKLIYIFV